MNIKSTLPIIGCVALLGLSSVFTVSASQTTNQVELKQRLIGQKVMSHQQRNVEKDKYIIQLNSTPLIKIQREEKSILNQINNNTTPKYVLGEFIKNKKEMLDRINFHRRKIEKSLITRLFNDIYFMR